MSRHAASLLILLLSLLILSACTALPDDIEPVGDFDIKRYTGKWYEIARLDNRFEKGMNNVTAEYRIMEDGGLSVTNRGYLASEDEWKVANGKAYFVGEQDTGHLKVSFFGPFYGSYVVFELDNEDYGYAFVTSHDKSYLWLLSRKPEVSDETLHHFLYTTMQLGFDTRKLVMVSHNRSTEDRYLVNNGEH